MSFFFFFNVPPTSDTGLVGEGASLSLKCSLGSKPCRDGKECVLYSHVCDGEKDCKDGSDERNCERKCKTGTVEIQFILIDELNVTNLCILLIQPVQASSSALTAGSV